MHHGLANALMIDTVLAWNFEVVPQKFDELAHVVGIGAGGTQHTPLPSLKTQPAAPAADTVPPPAVLATSVRLAPSQA